MTLAEVSTGQRETMKKMQLRRRVAEGALPRDWVCGDRRVWPRLRGPLGQDALPLLLQQHLSLQRELAPIHECRYHSPRCIDHPSSGRCHGSAGGDGRSPSSKPGEECGHFLLWQSRGRVLPLVHPWEELAVVAWEAPRVPVG